MFVWYAKTTSSSVTSYHESTKSRLFQNQTAPVVTWIKRVAKARLNSGIYEELVTDFIVVMTDHYNSKHTTDHYISSVRDDEPLVHQSDDV